MDLKTKFLVAERGRERVRADSGLPVATGSVARSVLSGLAARGPSEERSSARKSECVQRREAK